MNCVKSDLRTRNFAGNKLGIAGAALLYSALEVGWVFWKRFRLLRMAFLEPLSGSWLYIAEIVPGLWSGFIYRVYNKGRSTGQWLGDIGRASVKQGGWQSGDPPESNGVLSSLFSGG